MNLQELKVLLQIPPGAVNDDVLLQLQLDAAIAKVQRYCRYSFCDNLGVINLPPEAKIAVKIFVEGMGTNEAIQSDSVSGAFSKTYREGGYDAAAKAYLKPFRRLRYV